jgi:hypothetical protein
MLSGGSGRRKAGSAVADERLHCKKYRRLGGAPGQPGRAVAVRRRKRQKRRRFNPLPDRCGRAI